MTFRQRLKFDPDAVKKWFQRIHSVLGQDFGEIERLSRSKAEQWLLKTAKTVQLAFIGFVQDHCTLRASALTFGTLFAIVPLLAFAFSVTKGLEFQGDLRAVIISKIPEAFREVVENIFIYVENTNAKALGTFGLLFLLVTVVKTLTAAESTFNMIWSVKTARPIHRKFADYVSVIVVAPVLALTAIGFQSAGFIQRALAVGVVSRLWETLLPFAVIWVCFTFVYMFLPNTKVRFHAAAVAGVFTGFCWLIAQWAYLRFQVDLTKANKIYGGFAAVPFFIMWVYIAWIVTLLGGELSFAIQNARLFVPTWAQREMTPKEEEAAALSVMNTVTEHYMAGQGPLATERIVQECGLPFRLVSTVLKYLTDSGVAVKASGETGGYLPGIPPDDLTVKRVLDAVRNHGQKAGELDPSFGGYSQAVENDLESMIESRFGATPLGTKAERGDLGK